MSVNVITFQTALEEAEGYKNRHLLLGNGFSIACKPTIFSYPSLYSEAKKNMSPALIAVFEALGTQDFERVIKLLNDASTVAKVYLGSSTSLAQTWKDDAKQLKTDLIQAVAGTHPGLPYEVSDEECAACRSFLANFISAGSAGKVYTFNYDLLLYWVLRREGDELDFSHVSLKHIDGFRKDLADVNTDYVEWQGEGAAVSNQNIHYLHGALHLFDVGYQLQKYTWVNTGKPLVEQANEAFSKNAFPVFVAEGETQSKLTKIMHNAYLHHNLKSFSSMCRGSQKGTALFVYGHSFAKNDEHVVNKIGYGKLDHLFVSLYRDTNSAANQDIRKNVDFVASLRSARSKPLEITYFDAESAAVWG